jgi:hypothetical protein
VFSLDVVDAMGRHEVGVSSTVVKTRLGRNQEKLGEYTTQPPENELATMKEEGCNVAGFVAVNKVPGNFHISAHSSMHLVQFYLSNRLNLQHVIHSLWIGEKYLTPKEFPGHLHPLDATTHLTEDAATIYEYFLDIVPTKYERFGQVAKGYQIVAHKNSFSAGHQMPAIFFRYTLSPVQVVHVIKRKSLTHFLVRENPRHPHVPCSVEVCAPRPHCRRICVRLSGASSPWQALSTGWCSSPRSLCRRPFLGRLNSVGASALAQR